MNGLLRSSIYSWRQNKPTAGYEAAGENAKAARAAAEHRFIVNCAPVSLKRSHKNGGCAAGSSRASGRESLLSDWLHGEKLARRLVSATGLASFTGLHSWRPRQPARSDYPHSQQDKLYSRSSPPKTGCTAGTLPGTQPSKYSLPLAKIARHALRKHRRRMQAAPREPCSHAHPAAGNAASEFNFNCFAAACRSANCA